MRCQPAVTPIYSPDSYWKDSDDKTKATLRGGFGWSTGPRDDANGCGYSCVNYVPANLFTQESEFTEVFLHEWLHQVEAFYGAQGVPLPRGGLHGNDNYGFKHKGGWKHWYEAFLNAELKEKDGRQVGLGEEAWRLGTIRDEAALLTPAYLTADRRRRNLLADGSFEDVSPKQWAARSWRNNPGAVSFTDREARSGKQSAVIHATQDDDVQLVQRVAVKPNTRYLLSGWIKTKDVAIVQPGGGMGASLSVWGGYEGSPSRVGTTDWTYAALVIASGERKEIEVAARLGYHGSTATGTAWFDDLCLIEIGHSPDRAAWHEQLRQADQLDATGVQRRNEGKYVEAEKLFRQALAIQEEALPVEHPRVARSLHNLAVSLLEQGKYTEAEKLFRQVLTIREKMLLPQHPDLASSIHALAAILRIQGKYANSEQLFRQALAIWQKVLPADSHEIANTLNSLAVNLDEQGKYVEAEMLFRQALAIGEKKLPAGHLDLVSSLRNLAVILQREGKYAEAEQLFRRVLAIQEKALPVGHPGVAFTLGHLASNLEYQGKDAEAEELCRLALALEEKALPAGHPRIAYTLRHLANFLKAQGKHAEADQLYSRALAMLEKAFPADHPHIVSSLVDVATIRWSQGKHLEAETLYRRALGHPTENIAGRPSGSGFQPGMASRSPARPGEVCRGRKAVTPGTGHL